MGGISQRRAMQNLINDNKITISGRPDWNRDIFTHAKCKPRSNRRNSASISTTVNTKNIFINDVNNVYKPEQKNNFKNVNKHKIKKSESITGLCTVDGKLVTFVVDTGATKSVMSNKFCKSEELIPFKSKALTANGNEIRISGTKDCEIKLGDHVNHINVLVSPEVHDEMLLGMDYLSKSDVTKPYIEGIREAIDEASKETEAKELPFKEIDLFREIITAYEDLSEEGFIMVPHADEIGELMYTELRNLIDEALKQIEANGVLDLTTTDMIEHEIELKPGAIPIRQKRRPVPPHYVNQFKKSIQEMEDAGLIESSRSPWSSPIHIVRKEGGQIRLHKILIN